MKGETEINVCTVRIILPQSGLGKHPSTMCFCKQDFYFQERPLILPRSIIPLPIILLEMSRFQV
jgi:hypothetical protein